jgi:methyl-accepting chemotaxis protein
MSETTAAMDELDASFLQSAEQAEVSATRARQALTLTEDGTGAVQQTLGGMANLKGKVEAIAEQILRLSEQTSQPVRPISWR